MTRPEEVQAKLERLRAWMSQEGYGTVILSTQANFAWITAGGDNHVLLTTEAGVGRVVLTTAGQYVLTSNIEAPRLADEELESLPFEILDAGWHVQDDAAALEMQVLTSLDQHGRRGGRAARSQTARQRSDLYPERF